MTRMLLLPAELDGVVHLTAGEDMQPIYDAIVAASPGQGAVTAAQLEAAAEAAYKHFCQEVEAIGCKTGPWSEFSGRPSWITRQRRAFETLGLQVQP